MGLLLVLGGLELLCGEGLLHCRVHVRGRLLRNVDQVRQLGGDLLQDISLGLHGRCQWRWVPTRVEL